MSLSSREMFLSLLTVLFLVGNFRELQIMMKGFVVIPLSLPLSSTLAFPNTTTTTTTVQVQPPPSSSLLLQRLKAFRQENDAVSQGGEKVFSHFLMHIPKTGASYASNAINRVLWPAQYAANVTAAIRVCNQGIIHPRRFHDKYAESYKGVRCAMWMSEAPWTPHANHVYTILRNPQTHVLSQYFHCKESREARKANRNRFMPLLDEWLQAWVNVTENVSAPEPSHYRCNYNPINHQSRLVKFIPGNETKEQLKQDLKRRFVVIGDQSRMEKSVCVVSLMYSGLLSQDCNCTSSSSTSPTNQHNQEKRVDHGVHHHGDTFELSYSQKEAIRILTTTDQMLYELGQEIFDEQVREIEHAFGITLCDERKSR